MDALHYLFTVLPLSLGGLDPAPALIAAVFLTNPVVRKPRASVLTFGAVLIGGTAVWGLVLSKVVGERIRDIPWHEVLRVLLHSGLWTVALKLALAAGLLVYAVISFRKRGRQKQEKSRTAAGLLVVALGFVALVTSDVPFVATVALSSHQPFGVQILGLGLWAIISQVPLFALCVAVALGKHGAFARWLEKVWTRVRPVIGALIPAACTLIALGLIVDVAVHLVLIA